MWGYRRIHAWLLHREKIDVGKKKVLSIMRKNELLVKQVVHKAKRIPQRMMRTIKEEVIWLNEFSSFDEEKKTLHNWIEVDYNKLYVHSPLGYKSPKEFEEFYYNKKQKEVA